MQIEFVRSGGLAGILLTARVDLQNLPQEESEALETQIQAARFFDLPGQIRPEAPVPDSFEYQITVSSPQRTHTVTASESSINEPLRRLVDHLTDLARTGKYR
ncbi:MAG TPA: protealysin inhibitor emfourin [Anaerolineales bacterium]|nr:protealysin inhibitor emfourin [Anaerolineales bacterium]